MMVIYQFMGLFATILTLASLVLAWAIARRGKALNVTLRDGLVWGLVLTFPLTLISAGTLSSMPGHFVGAHDPALGGAVFFGWARDVGDLRVGHFFATHALHAVPLIALLAMPLPQMLGRVIVALGALGYTGLVAFTFFQALQGQPFLPNLL
jgi:hypothetical protein